MRTQVTCTKATSVITSRAVHNLRLPPNIRRASSAEIKYACMEHELIGKGTFANCYATQFGPMRVCVKVLNAGVKYKSLFYAEAKILSEICHHNLPWLHAFCDVPNITAIVMTFHPYDGQKSLNVYSALFSPCQSRREVSMNNWKQILIGSISALVYLHRKNIIHNDIKTDNIVIETQNETDVRAILIDFNKACFADEGRFYKLSSQEITKYAKNHPQVAPEVRRGIQKQSFASDVYSFGRVFNKINSNVLKLPCLYNLSMLCLSETVQKRPTGDELSTFLTNLFASLKNCYEIITVH